jgi:hypothetical protein
MPYQILILNGKKKMSLQLKIGHIINSLIIYKQNLRRLTEGPMVHDFEGYGPFLRVLNVRDQTCNLSKR